MRISDYLSHTGLLDTAITNNSLYRKYYVPQFQKQEHQTAEDPKYYYKPVL